MTISLTKVEYVQTMDALHHYIAKLQKEYNVLSNPHIYTVKCLMDKLQAKYQSEYITEAIEILTK